MSDSKEDKKFVLSLIIFCLSMILGLAIIANLPSLYKSPLKDGTVTVQDKSYKPARSYFNSYMYGLNGKGVPLIEYSDKWTVTVIQGDASEVFNVTEDQYNRVSINQVLEYSDNTLYIP